MTDEEARAGSDGGGNVAGTDGAEERTPMGTLFVLMVYLMVLAGMWGTMYWLLVSR